MLKFLDNTGLNTLWEKIKAKITAAIQALDSNKTSTDGTNVQVKVTETDGKISAVNVTTDNTENKNNKVSTWQATPDNTHYPSEKLVKDSLDAKAAANEVVAICDSNLTVYNVGANKWFKIAERTFAGTLNGFLTWWDVEVNNSSIIQTGTLCCSVSYSYGGTELNSYSSFFCDEWMGASFKFVTRGLSGPSITIELWASLNHNYTGLSIRERSNGNIKPFILKGYWKYYSYLNTDGSAAPTEDAETHTKVNDVEIIIRQHSIASPTNDNLVAMDANGLVKDSGLAKSSVESAISKAGTAIQGVKVNNTTLTPDANKIVNVPLVTTSADGAMSAADKTKLDGIAADAEVNQNAFSNVKVGSTTVTADSKTDTLELASSSAITLTPDAANDKVTIGVSTMGAASSSAAGTAGIVPAPGAGKQTSFLRGDGTWVVPTNTDTLVKATAKTDNVNYKILATASASPTSGNATEAVYDTDISLNPSTNTITSNISGNAATATKPAVTTLTASDNLNNVGGSTAGDVLWYKWASGSDPANVPIAGSAVMEVVRTHSNKYITQTVYTADHSVYRRECINGTWHAWYAYSKSTHTHGNITSGGALQTTDVAIANGDKLVVTDSSDSNKVARASLTFDGATTNQMLSKKGEWSDTIAKARAVVDYAEPSKAIEIGWDGSSVTSLKHFAVYTDSANGYNKAIKDCTLGTVKKAINGTSVGSTAVPVFINADGAPQVCTDDFVHDDDVTSTYSSTGTAPVNGKAVAAAIGGLDVSSVGGDGKYISAISETDGKISATATTMDTTPTANSKKAVTSGGIKAALDGKASSSHEHDNLYIRASSGNKNLSFGGTTTLGTVSGNNVNLVMPKANADTYEVTVDSTSFADALAEFNANKKLILKVGKAGSGAFSTTYYLPLYRIQFSGNTITQFVWMLDSDAYGDASGSNTYGSIQLYKLSESGWSSSSDNVEYAKSASEANTCGKANLLDDWASTDGGKIAVGWDHDSIEKVSASATGSSSMAVSFHLAAYAGKSDGIARIKDVLANKVQVGDSIKWNGWSIVVGSTGTDANTLYFV